MHIFRTSDTIPVSFPVFPDHNETIDNVVYMRKDTFLGPRRNNTERKSALVLLLKNRIHGPHGAGAFAWTIHVIEISYRIVNTEPISIVLDQFAHIRFTPGVWTLITPKTAGTKFS